MLQVKGGYISEFASACVGERRSVWGKARIWQVRKTGVLDMVYQIAFRRPPNQKAYCHLPRHRSWLSASRPELARRNDPSVVVLAVTRSARCLERMQVPALVAVGKGDIGFGIPGGGAGA
jgi:hypothetical protein